MNPDTDKTKVYIVLIHRAGELPWINSVYAHAEDANNKANELNEEFLNVRNGEWADFISEELR